MKLTIMSCGVSVEECEKECFGCGYKTYWYIEELGEWQSIYLIPIGFLNVRFNDRHRIIEFK